MLTKKVINPVNTFTNFYKIYRSCSHSNYLDVKYTKIRYTLYDRSSSIGWTVRYHAEIDTGDMGYRICLKRK